MNENWHLQHALGRLKEANERGDPDRLQRVVEESIVSLDLFLKDLRASYFYDRPWNSALWVDANVVLEAVPMKKVKEPESPLMVLLSRFPSEDNNGIWGFPSGPIDSGTRYKDAVAGLMTEWYPDSYGGASFFCSLRPTNAWGIAVGLSCLVGFYNEPELTPDLMWFAVDQLPEPHTPGLKAVLDIAAESFDWKVASSWMIKDYSSVLFGEPRRIIPENQSADATETD